MKIKTLTANQVADVIENLQALNKVFAYKVENGTRYDFKHAKQHKSIEAFNLKNQVRVIENTSEVIYIFEEDNAEHVMISTAFQNYLILNQ